MSNITVKFNWHCACGAHYAGTLPGDVFAKIHELWKQEHRSGTDARGIYHGHATAAQSRAARDKADREGRA